MMSLMYASLNPRLSMSDLERIVERSTDAKVKCIEAFGKAVEKTPAEYLTQVLCETLPILIQTLCWL